jgi:chitin deacetylase
MDLPKRMLALLALTAAGGAFLAVVIVSPHTIVRCCLKPVFSEILWEVDTTAPFVALTVDDGPDPVYTPVLLRILKNCDIQATFFLVGERARRYPDLVSAICAAGHEIGNHTDTWRNTLETSLQAFEQDLCRAEQTFEGTGCTTRFFRPAGIWIRRSQLKMVHRHHYRCTLGSAYAYDPFRPPASYIAWVIGRGLKPGAIIVIHDSGGDRSSTLEAVPGIVRKARQKGLRFATLSALIAGQER